MVGDKINEYNPTCELGPKGCQFGMVCHGIMTHVKTIDDTFLI